jgi:hypothetical protein
MGKIIRLTESDLTRLVRRVIKEQEENDMEHEEQYTTRSLLMLRNKSANVVSRHLNNLSDKIKFIAIINCEYADFSGVDICGLPKLVFVNLKGTENNFEEQGYECNIEEDSPFYHIV